MFFLYSFFAILHFSLICQTTQNFQPYLTLFFRFQIALHCPKMTDNVPAAWRRQGFTAAQTGAKHPNLHKLSGELLPPLRQTTPLLTVHYCLVVKRIFNQSVPVIIFWNIADIDFYNFPSIEFYFNNRYCVCKFSSLRYY